MTEPRTAAGLGRRNIERYLDQFGITTNDAELYGMLDGWHDAIEAEARAAALDEARAAVKRAEGDRTDAGDPDLYPRALAAIDALREKG